MASIYKHGKRWRAQVLVDGQRQGKVFDTKSAASQWAMLTEAEGRKAPAVTMSVSEALDRQHKLFEKDDKSRSDLSRALRLKADAIANRRLADVSKNDLMAYRERRGAAGVSDATIRRELNLLRGMFRRCRDEWGWMTHNPFTGFSMPKSPESRKRRISPDEVKQLRHAADVLESLNAVTITNRVGLAFLFGLETAMRSGEIVALTWGHVHIDKRYVHIPKSKNGDKRDVPLSPFAIELLNSLPHDGDAPCFMVNDSQRDAIWRKLRSRTTVENLHFHDSRAEGIWRLSKKLDVLQLARVIGHRDIKSLLIYYQESAEDMAASLAA